MTKKMILGWVLVAILVVAGLYVTLQQFKTENRLDNGCVVTTITQEYSNGRVVRVDGTSTTVSCQTTDSVPIVTACIYPSYRGYANGTVKAVCP